MDYPVGVYSMTSAAKHFIANDDGAVTVDWVILAAGVIGLALAAMGVVMDGTEDLTNDVESQLTSQLISTSF